MNAPAGAALRRAVVDKALALGFDVVGIARADEPLELEHERFLAYLAAGYHGSMAYLAEDPDARRRLDGAAVLPGARSVVCVATRYARDPLAEAADPPLARRIARYARGQDYHNVLRKRVRRLAAFVRRLGPDVRARPLCDVEPVLERAWAARAGLGFVGKNGLVIVPGMGSYVLLGEVVTTLALPPDEPIAERCGSCTRCLDACPTDAFVAPFVLDARRCVSYATIEDRLPAEPAAVGALPAADPLAQGWLFGCDACQEACPFNRTAAPPPARTRAFAPLPRWGEVGLEALVATPTSRFGELVQGSPLHRATPEGLARNALHLAHGRLRDGDEGRDDALRALAAGLRHEHPGVRALAARLAVGAHAPGAVDGEATNPVGAAEAGLEPRPR